MLLTGPSGKDASPSLATVLATVCWLSMTETSTSRSVPEARAWWAQTPGLKLMGQTSRTSRYFPSPLNIALLFCSP